MPGASTKRARSDDDPESLPSPPKRSRSQTRRTTLESRKSEKNYHSDDDDETSSDDPTSSSGSSVDYSDDDSEGEGEEEQDTENRGKTEENGTIPSIQARQKPRIHRIEKNNDIMSRLTAFLPQMKGANEDLERELAAGRAKELQLDNANEESEGRFIEMNLGLGVLEEKRSDDEDDSSDDEDEGPASEEGMQHPTELPNRPKDSGVLGKLMGVKKDESKKPTIEEMNE